MAFANISGMSLEIIHLRLAGDRPEGLVEEIYRSLAHELEVVVVYRRSTIASDLAVHLHVDDAEEQPSDLGIRLAAELRRFGMVEHSVWLEEQRRAP